MPQEETQPDYLGELTQPTQTQIVPMNNTNYKQQIMETLGAVEPNQGGTIMDILSQRFKPTIDDTSNALAKTLSSGNYVSGDEVAQNRYAKALQSGGTDPSSVREYRYFQSLNPEQQGQYMGVKRAQPWVNLGDRVGKPDPINGGFSETVNKGVPPQEQPALKGAQQEAKSKAEVDVQREAGFTKAQSALRGFEQQANLVVGEIDKALGIINKPFSAATGYSRALGGGGNLPNSDSRALDNHLKTIQANIGFDKLQNMRENSPTGGALGQISDFENRLLQAVNGALDPLQGDQLKQNLETIKQLYPLVMEERRRAFEQDYGGYAPLGGNQQLPPANPTLNQQSPVTNGWSIEPAN